MAEESSYEKATKDVPLGRMAVNEIEESIADLVSRFEKRIGNLVVMALAGFLVVFRARVTCQMMVALSMGFLLVFMVGICALMHVVRVELCKLLPTAGAAQPSLGKDSVEVGALGCAELRTFWLYVLSASLFVTALYVADD